MGFQDVIIVPTEKNSNALRHVKRNFITKLDDEKEGLSIKHVISLAENGFFKEHGHIHEFLENSEIQLITPLSEPRNQELEERIQKLKAQQANEEYRRMTKEMMHPKEQRTSLREDVKMVTSQITAVINFVLTVIGSFFFVYKAVEYALPERNIPAQVLMGILASTVVALADLYFLIRSI